IRIKRLRILYTTFSAYEEKMRLKKSCVDSLSDPRNYFSSTSATTIASFDPQWERYLRSHIASIVFKDTSATTIAGFDPQWERFRLSRSTVAIIVFTDTSMAIMMNFYRRQKASIPSLSTLYLDYVVACTLPSKIQNFIYLSDLCEYNNVYEDVASSYSHDIFTRGTANIRKEFSALASEIGNINIVDDNDDVNNNLIQSFGELSDDTLSGDDDDEFNSCGTWELTWGSKELTVIQDFNTLGKNKEVTPNLGKRKREVITIDLDIHPLIAPYSKIIFALQEHHVEEDSQRARHLIEILKWSVVDRDVFVEVGWRDTQLNEISTPRTEINLVISVLQNHIKTLKALESKKKTYQ
ncbi:12782_t:CDS:2, partial [Gigaspora rosea]